MFMIIINRIDAMSLFSKRINILTKVSQVKIHKRDLT